MGVCVCVRERERETESKGGGVVAMKTRADRKTDRQTES